MNPVCGIKAKHTRFFGCCCCGLSSGVKIISVMKCIIIVFSIWALSTMASFWYNLPYLLVAVDSFLACAGAFTSNASKAATYLRSAIVIVMIELVLNIIGCILAWSLLGEGVNVTGHEEVADRYEHDKHDYETAVTVILVFTVIINYYWMTSLESLAQKKLTAAEATEGNPENYEANPVHSTPQAPAYAMPPPPQAPAYATPPAYAAPVTSVYAASPEPQVVYVHHQIERNDEDHFNTEQEYDYLRKKETV